jgi:hypothetical protein
MCMWTTSVSSIGDREQHGARYVRRTHDRALPFLDVEARHDSAHRRGDRDLLEVVPSALEVGLDLGHLVERGLMAGGSHLIGRLRSLDLLAGEIPLCREGPRPIEIALRLLELDVHLPLIRLRSLEGCPKLIHRRFQGNRIELEKELSLPHVVSLLDGHARYPPDRVRAHIDLTLRLYVAGGRDRHDDVPPRDRFLLHGDSLPPAGTHVENDEQRHDRRDGDEHPVLLLH